MAAAVSRRRTDRRAFGARQVPGDVLDALCRLAESEGAYLHVVCRTRSRCWRSPASWPPLPRPTTNCSSRHSSIVVASAVRDDLCMVGSSRGTQGGGPGRSSDGAVDSGGEGDADRTMRPIA